MAQYTKGGMWCGRCGSVMGVKNTHKVRNTGSVLGEFLLPGASLLGSKIEGYVCPNCGGRVHRAKPGQQSPQPAGPIPTPDGVLDASDEHAKFDVILVAAGEPRVIEVVCAATGFGSRYTASLVDELPQAIRQGLRRAQAQKLRDDLEAAGATVGLKVEGGPTGIATAVPESEPSPSLGAPTDALDQLRKLGELRDTGVVTAAEFEAKKAELLGHI